MIIFIYIFFIIHMFEEFLIRGLVFLLNYRFFLRADFISYLRFYCEIDNISWILIILRLWLILICLLSVEKNHIINYSLLLNLFFVLLFRLIITFSLKNFLFFYFILELSFLPLFYIVLGWGYISDRFIAGYYLMFYTIVGSLPFLMIILYSILKLNITNFYILDLSIGLIKNRFFLFFLFLFIFLIKFPLYGLHLWLLKAHVEAPVFGSIILAGIILKLGGYGIWRFYRIWSLNILGKEFFIFWGVWGGILISYICIIRNDVKLLVASSSVVHIRFCICCFFLLTNFSSKSRVLIIVGHGLCSSGLFYFCNIFYCVFSRRRLTVSKGLIIISPPFVLFWGLFCLGNIACPPTINLLSELMIISSLLCFEKSLFFVIFFLSFFSSCYRLYLFYIFSFDNNYLRYFNFRLLNINSLNISILHLLPLNLLIISTFIF